MDIDVLIEDEAWRVVPEPEALARAAIAAVFEVLERPEPETGLAIVLIGDAAMAELNARWRGRPGPTNVLSFAAGGAAAASALGDVVLAAGLVASEARAQGKPLANHTSHLIIHGVLHLLGYDHERSAAECRRMEALEKEVLQHLQS
jgi:probable rRNA maturation factor